MLTPQQALKQYFGFDQFREGQEQAIQRVLDGEHTLLVMPTGAGKSLAYQLPALLLPGLTLVISPLIALMKDQVDALVEAGIAATYLNSTLPAYETNRRIRAVLERDVKLLYIAPERLRNRQFTQTLARVQVSLLAVDEAHCISQWGHDFRPDYLQIGPTWQAMGKPTLLATTATAAPKVQQDILRLLGLQSGHIIVTGFNRPNLIFRAQYAPDERVRLEALQALLKNLNGSAIIYTATRRAAEEVSNYLQRAIGQPVGAYHGGMDKNQRAQIQNRFMRNQLKIVVATNAFGMGVDKSDVRLVAHYNMPATVEAYYQEAGRAGRDGLPAECVLFFSADDQNLQEWMIQSDTPGYQDLRQVYSHLAHAAADGSVHANYYELQDSTGLHPVKLRVVLSELEQAGLLYSLGNQGGYHSWKVQPFSDAALRQRAQAVAKRAEIRFELLDKMLEYAQLTTCRRQYLLNYFGDTAPPKAPNCCDNHGQDAVEDLPKAVTPQEWYPLIILETVRTLPKKAGRSLIAKILAGSQDKQVRQFGHQQHKFYGKLERLGRKQITALIDKLIERHYLSTTSVEGRFRRFTVVAITALGQQALDLRAALPLHLDEALPDVSQPVVKPSETVEETLALFQSGLPPAEIAARRSLSERTIYGHLAKLVERGAVKLGNVVSPEVEAAVLAAVEQAGSAAKLSPIKAILPEAVTWDEIRCVLAAHPELPRQTQEAAASSITPPSPSTGAPAHSSAPDQIILEAVARLNGSLGRTGLAQLLTGSKAGWLDAFAKHPDYGRLSDFSQRATLDIIDALIVDGKLQTTGGARPKVMLPAYDAGKTGRQGGEETGGQREEDEDKGLSNGGRLSAAGGRPTPAEAIMAVVADLEGLLTPYGLALLLTSSPGDVAPFSDHHLFARFYEVMETNAVEAEIGKLLAAGKLSVNQRGRLALGSAEKLEI